MAHNISGSRRPGAFDRTTRLHNGMAQQTGSNNLKIQSPLKIATFNVRGFKNQKKRSAVLRNFRLEKLDIIALQETHISDELEIRSLAKLWGGSVHYSPGSNRSKGLITLFHPRFKETDTQVIFHTDRFLISSVLIDNLTFFVINVYSPCIEREKLSFLNSLAADFLSHLGVELEGNVICMGDFNIALHDLDIVSGSPHAPEIRNALRDFMYSLGFVDVWRQLHSSEKAYTWSRSRPPSARRLDYVLVSETLFHYVVDSAIKGIGFSDHRMVSIKINPSSFKIGKGIYKLNTSLLNDKNYCKIIVKEINSTLDDYKDINDHLRWEMVKTNVREVSQQFSRFKMKDKADKQRRLIMNLNFLENSLIHTPDDKNLLSTISKVKGELELFVLEKAKGAQIRAGVKWIGEGEKSTKFFYGLEKSRNNLNTIKRLTKINGEIITDEREIVEEVGMHFRNIYNNNHPSNHFSDDLSAQFEDFASELNLPTLDENEVELCDAHITEAEVITALKQMNHGSSPGSDGLPVEFYKVFWHNIREPLMNSFDYSFITNSLSPSERLGVISLLHKGKELPYDCLNSWRPISLTNADYKLLAKVLSNRLDSVISRLIGEQQSGFMKGRQIFTIHRTIDDLLILQRTSNSPGVILAVDFKQAFDSISTGCILKTLKRFGFGQKFIRWITILNNDRIACVKNGGHISREFEMNNGVRQGCPISPQLFILAVEILAQKVIQDKNIVGLKPRFGCLPIKVCQYADDTTLFLQDRNDIERALLHINNFSVISGLFLNYNKSYALSTNGTRIDMGNVPLIYKDMIKILGIYFSNSKSASDIEENWLSRIENIQRIFGLWSRRDLSIIGKVLIIKTFGLSQLIFLFQSLILPRKVIDLVNTIFFRFLWKKRYNNKRAFEKVKRKVMFNDLDSGGLKMVNLLIFQDAILLRWAEALLSEGHQSWKDLALCFFVHVGGRVVFKSKTTAKQFKGLETVASPFWAAVLTKWLEYAENNSKNTCYLNDPIFNNQDVVYKGNPLFFPCCIRRNIVTIGNMFSNGRILTYQEFKYLHGDHPRCQLDYNALHNALKHLQTYTLNLNERFYFRGIVAGNLGRLYFYNSIKIEETSLSIGIWNRKFGIVVGPQHWRIVHALKETRLRTLSWKLVHNIYPTNILLQKMHLSDTMNCPHCGVPDFIEHFFFSCSRVQPLWREIEKDINAFLGCSITIKQEEVLLGFLGHNNYEKLVVDTINLALAIGRLSVSKFRYGKQRNIIEIYETERIFRKLWSDK